MKIENWIEVSSSVSERSSAPHGYYPNLKEANAAKITGWYSDGPKYRRIKVLRVGTRLYELTPIRKGKVVVVY